ncbi:MAG: hypothetical protein HQ514_06175 [Rhodospirillales bacterium]|nr:hypothetical protein [Rhodospirillales bacterium]
MIVLLQNVLTADQVAAILADLGRSGDDGAEAGDRHGGAIGAALMSHEPYINAILPTALTPFRFDRHVPDSVIQDRMDSPLSQLGTPQSMRIDAICVMFLTDPNSYDGGELIIDCSTTPTPLKLPAGNAVIFPATDFYTANPVERGERWIACCGIQSVVRGTREREILTEMWVALNDFKTLAPSGGAAENDGVKILGKARSNLIRLLADS